MQGNKATTCFHLQRQEDKSELELAAEASVSGGEGSQEGVTPAGPSFNRSAPCLLPENSQVAATVAFCNLTCVYSNNKCAA